MEKVSNSIYKGIAMMVVSSLMVCLGQLAWKLHYDQGLIYLFVGFALYGFGALLMIYAYQFGKLSVLQPILSLSYVFSIVLGYFILNESIDIKKITAVLLIMVGVTLIGSSNK